MARSQLNISLDSFAWLIYQEAEKYVNEHLADYEEWLLAHNLTDADKQTADD